MKLINRLTLWYLTITFFILLVGSGLVFYFVEREVISEESHRLVGIIRYSKKLLIKGAPMPRLLDGQTSVTEMDTSLAEIPITVKDTSAYDVPTRHFQRKLEAIGSYKLNNKHYRIYTYTFVGEADEIAIGVFKSLFWIFMLLLLGVWVLSSLISKKLLKPFYDTLNVIASFSLANKRQIHFSRSNVQEFQQLNAFVQSMTAKAQKDYQLLQETVENTSHEIQTPLTIARGKLELLLETNIDQYQTNFIMGALHSIDRLNKINRMLILLAKLENRSFTNIQTINFTSLLLETLGASEELMELKGLRLEKNLVEQVYVTMDPVTAEILLMNLVSNAIRHNVQNGTIQVSINEQSFSIANNGYAPNRPADQLFKRFATSSDGEDSIGLGLAIVKQICVYYGFDVSYQYEDNWHIINISFSKQKT